MCIVSICLTVLGPGPEIYDNWTTFDDIWTTFDENSTKNRRKFDENSTKIQIFDENSTKIEGYPYIRISPYPYIPGFPINSYK